MQRLLTSRCVPCVCDQLESGESHFWLCRYTSYGRHFTKGPQLEAVVQRLQDFLLAGDTVVDFSCGANEFVPMVKETALKSGIEVFGRAYDIITGRHFEDLIIKSWFEVKRGQSSFPLPCIGLLEMRLLPKDLTEILLTINLVLYFANALFTMSMK